MQALTTVTGKNQITLPKPMVKKASINKGDKLIATLTNGEITLKPAKSIIDDLVGIISTPNRLKKKDINNIIQNSKRIHFSKKK